MVCLQPGAAAAISRHTQHCEPLSPLRGSGDWCPHPQCGVLLEQGQGEVQENERGTRRYAVFVSHVERETWTHRLNCPQQPLPGYQPPTTLSDLLLLLLHPYSTCFFFLFSTIQSYHIPRGAPSSVLHSARHHPSLGISSHSHGEVMPGLFHDASGKRYILYTRVYTLWKLRGGVALLRMTWACQRGHLCGFRKSLRAGSVLYT